MTRFRQRVADLDDESQKMIGRLVDQDAHPHRMRGLGIGQHDQALAAHALCHQQTLVFEHSQRGRHRLVVDAEVLGQPGGSRQRPAPASPQHLAAQVFGDLLCDREKSGFSHPQESSEPGNQGQAIVSTCPEMA